MAKFILGSITKNNKETTNEENIRNQTGLTIPKTPVKKKTSKEWTIPLKKFWVETHSLADGFAYALRVNLIIALLSLLVVHFCPGVEEEFPILFQFFEGIIIFYEFLLKTGFTLLVLFFKFFSFQWGDIPASVYAIFSTAGDLLWELIHWIEQISFWWILFNQ